MSLVTPAVVGCGVERVAVLRSGVVCGVWGGGCGVGVCSALCEFGCVEGVLGWGWWLLVGVDACG